MMTEYNQAAFMAKYAHCADRRVLEKIWEAHTWKKVELDLSQEKSLKDLSPLTHLTTLQRLSVENTQVSNLSPLENLITLQYLYLGRTQVSDLSPLKDLVQLEVLYVSNTQVSDLSPLRGLIEKGIEVNWENKDGIYIKDTPLSNPPIEIAQQGNEAILRYWEEQERLNFTHL